MPTETTASAVNYAYYSRLTPGLSDYWRKMAAPRARVATLLGLLSERPPRRLVDLGCGNGQLLEEIAARYPQAELHGVDISDPQLADNRRRAPRITFHHLDLCQPVPAGVPLAGRCDAVVAAEIIEHVDDPARFLRSARALAAPGGRLLLSTQSGPVRETERRVGHLRHFTAEELAALLAEAGWAPLRVWNSGFPFHDLSKWYANLNPDASMASFSERAYGPAQNLICFALRLAFRLNSRRRGAQLYAVAERGHA